MLLKIDFINIDNIFIKNGIDNTEEK